MKKVFILDWKTREQYKNLEELAEIRVSEFSPINMEGIDAVIIHATGTLNDYDINLIIEKAEKFPVIFHGLSEFCFNHLKKEKSNFYRVENMQNLYEQLKEVL